jgi:hypothetical protein
MASVATEERNLMTRREQRVELGKCYKIKGG